jgi:hypothetical protein
MSRSSFYLFTRVCVCVRGGFPIGFGDALCEHTRVSQMKTVKNFLNLIY